MNIFQIIGDLLHLGSILLLLWKMLSERRCTGLSLKSQTLYAIVFCTRYVDMFTHFISWYNTLMKLFFIVSSIHIVYLMKSKFRTTYDRSSDTLRIRWLLGAAAVLAVLFHRDFSFHGLLFAFSQWLEMVAIMPQLAMLQRAHSADIITARYLVCLGGYRAFYILNWIYRYFAEGRVVLLNWVAGLIQTILYADFFYHYFTCVVKEGRIALPS